MTILSFNNVKNCYGLMTILGGMIASSLSHAAVLKVGTILEPPHLDPTAGAAAAIDEITYQNVFEGLVTINKDAEIIPALAKKWKISDNGLDYTFNLRKNVVFHDGTTFDAEDVVFTLNRIVSDKSVNASKKLYMSIANVKAIDKYTVHVKLSQKVGDFLYRLTYGDAVIVAPETADSNKRTPIGTGAFKFDKWRSGSHITLSKNTEYWGKPASINQVEFRFINDATAVTTALLAGDIDGFANVSALETVGMFKSDPRFNVLQGTTEGETILAMNNGRGALRQKIVRQAISHAVNRTDVIAGTSYGYGVPIGTHFAPHHPAYVDLTDTYPYDVSHAKKLLSDTGVLGQTLEMVLPPTPHARRSGEIIASQLRQVGLNVNITPVEWAVWLKRVFKNKDYDLTIVSHIEPMDIEIYGRDNYYFNYKNPDFNTLMKRLDMTTDVTERNTLYQQAQRMITDDAVNVYLYQMPRVGIWKTGISGVWRNAPQPAIVVTDIRLK